jgi:hypothetical protein
VEDRLEEGAVEKVCAGCEAKYDLIREYERIGHRLLDVAMLTQNVGDEKGARVIADELRTIGRSMENLAQRLRLA